MKRTCIWLVAAAGLVTVAGTTHAGTPALTMLFLPQVFGQEPPPRPESTEAPGADASRVRQRRAETPSFSARTPSQENVADALISGLYMLRTASYFTPGGALRLLSDLASMQVSVEPEVLPMPKLVNGATQAGSFTIGAGFNTDCGLVGSIVLQERACAKAGGPCGACEKPRESECAATCDDGVCCQAPRTVAAAKPCKCCEDCKDCKDCTCGKKPALSQHIPFNMGGIYVGGLEVQCQQVELIPPPPCVSEMPRPLMVPFGPPPMCVGGAPCMPMHEALPYSVEELHDLIRQRQMVTCAIEQIERELMRLTFEKHLHAQAPAYQTVVVPVAHHAQKVHLATEHFDAHCDSLRCQDGTTNRLVLEGNVHLVCKTTGHPVRIEAPRVVVNMKDGTFTVESQPTTVPLPNVSYGPEFGRFFPGMNGSHINPPTPPVYYPAYQNPVPVMPPTSLPPGVKLNEQNYDLR